MNVFTIAFLVANSIALLTLPRPWSALALMVGALYIPLDLGLELGPFNFPVIRLLIIVGAMRVLLRLEVASFRVNGLDRVLICWAAWAVISSFLHEDVTTTLVNRLGLVFNACGIYFLLRIFCQSLEDIVQLCLMLAILLIPLSFAMVWETYSGYNLFSITGGTEPYSEIRGGTVRAQGPFAHSILAGTVGAANLPLVVALWNRHRKASIAGILACLAIIIASGSSGPILSGVLGIGALLLWQFRQHVKVLRWLALIGYVLLDLITNAPAYYILARIDLTGGSTGWHRAALIEAAIAHFSEWWLWGTDFTRHWIAYGVPWSANHIDITNYYIQMGVWGGITLMLLFIATLAVAFSYVGRWLRERERNDAVAMDNFMVWALGASLFSHATTFISVSYFDQSVVFLYMTLAAISSGFSASRLATGDSPTQVAGWERMSPDPFGNDPPSRKW